MTLSEEQSQNPSWFEKPLVALARAKVDFAVAGGLAVMFNGYYRATMDADIIVDDAPENLDRMLAVLRDWGEGWARELSPGDFTPEEGAVRLGEDFEMDIFTRLRGLSWKDFKARLRHTELQGVPVPYLSPQDLLHCKENSHREKDYLDVVAMKKIIQQEQSFHP